MCLQDQCNTEIFLSPEQTKYKASAPSWPFEARSLFEINIYIGLFYSLMHFIDVLTAANSQSYKCNGLSPSSFIQ